MTICQGHDISTNPIRLTILSTVAAVESRLVDALESVDARSVPQLAFVLFARVRSVHVLPPYHVLLVHHWMLHSFNLVTITELMTGKLHLET